MSALAQRPFPPVPDSLQGPLRRATTPAQRVEVLLRVAEAYSSSNDTLTILGYIRWAERLGRQHRLPRLVGKALLKQADAYEMAGLIQQAVAKAQAALPLVVGSPGWASVQHRLGALYVRQGRNGDALAALRAAYHAYTPLHNTFEQAQIDNIRGKLFSNQGALDSAEFYTMRAMRSLHSHPASKSQAEAAALNNLGLISYKRRHYAAAGRYLHQALALRRALHDSLNIAKTFLALAQLAPATDSLPQSLRYARQALKMSRHFQQLGTQLEALAQLGSTWRQLGRPDSAEFYYRQALATTQRGGDHMQRGAALLSLAQLYDATHRPAEALGRALELDALDSTYRFNHTAAANLELLAKLAHERHDDAAALTYFQRLRRLEQRQAAVASSKEMAALRARFDAERTEQQLALATARAATEAQRATALYLLTRQHDAAYRDTLSRREREGLLQQLLAQQQASRAAQASQQVQALTHRSRVLTQQARLQRQAARLQAQQQELAILRTRQELIGVSALATLGLLLSGGLFWQYRRRQTRRQVARDQELRARLAADLHDDVGALLTQISLQSDLLRETSPSPGQLQERLQRLGDTSRRATRQMADVVWGLHSATVALPELLHHMRDYAHELLAPSGLVVDFAVAPEVLALAPTPEVSQHLYLIYKESLHNALKHARGASQVFISLSRAEGQLCLSVRDNAPQRSPTLRAGGRGLRNMRQRAEAVGGVLQVAADDAGFGVMARLPVPRSRA